MTQTNIGNLKDIFIYKSVDVVIIFLNLKCMFLGKTEWRRQWPDRFHAAVCMWANGKSQWHKAFISHCVWRTSHHLHIEKFAYKYTLLIPCVWTYWQVCTMESMEFNPCCQDHHPTSSYVTKAKSLTLSSALNALISALALTSFKVN